MPLFPTLFVFEISIINKSYCCLDQMSKVVLVVFVLFGVGFLAVLFTKLLEVITPAMTTLIHRKASQQREKLFKLFKERHKSKSP